MCAPSFDVRFRFCGDILVSSLLSIHLDGKAIGNFPILHESRQPLGVIGKNGS